MTASRNRITPLGEVEATTLRGAWTGNRGRIHEGREIVRFHASDLWIICELEFRGRWSEQWQPNHYTFLFFHDEAVAFAAGHRPCAECRRQSYCAYRDAWARELDQDPPSAKEINRRLHAERLHRGTHRRRFHPMPWRNLPDGTFVLVDQRPFLVRGDRLIEWTLGGYGDYRKRPARGEAEVVTPPATVSVLRGGYPVQIDPSALCSQRISESQR